jgi:hypothetical protein
MYSNCEPDTGTTGSFLSTACCAHGPASHVELSENKLLLHPVYPLRALFFVADCAILSFDGRQNLDVNVLSLWGMSPVLCDIYS